MTLENLFIWLATGFVLGLGMGAGSVFITWLGNRIKAVVNG